MRSKAAASIRHANRTGDGRCGLGPAGPRAGRLLLQLQLEGEAAAPGLLRLVARLLGYRPASYDETCVAGTPIAFLTWIAALSYWCGVVTFC